MVNVNNKKKRKTGPMQLALWIIFLFTVGAVAYFSFQNGEESKLVGKDIINAIAAIRYRGAEATSQQMTELTYVFRQTARALAFFFLGMVGTMAIHISLRKLPWLFKSGFAVMILAAVAYFTEKLKIYIPSRHYSYQEMLISLTAVAAGFLLVSAITLLTAVCRFMSSSEMVSDY